MNATVGQILESRLVAELSDDEAGRLVELVQPRNLSSGEYRIKEGTTDDS